MTRREFVRGAGTALLASVGHVSGCTAARSEIRSRSPDPVGPPLGSDEEIVLAHAALAPSGHNTQPWTVRILERRRWTVGVDPGRTLSAVDPPNRELVISIGTFVENLALAANALGLAAEVSVRSVFRDAPELVEVRLAAAAEHGDGRDLERMRQRRTLRRGYLHHPIRREDLDAICEPYDGAAAWFSAGSREACRTADMAVEAFRKQTGRDDAQRELARWIRVTDVEIERNRDGLTPATMQVGTLAALYMRHFMDRDAVLGKRFRDASIDATAHEASEGAGWLVVTSWDETTAALVDTGRRFERMALRLRERRLAAHPMSQSLEEEPWRGQLASELALRGTPQFLLRVGYVDDCPAPVSPRRPPRAFARVA